MSTRFAKLSESETCRAAYETESGERLCLSTPAWKEALARGTAPSGCSNWRGRWRPDGRPLADEPGRALLLAGALGRESPWLRIERLREALSRKLEPWDALGVARKLLLDEKAGGSAPEMLRRLGFVHVLTATGIHLYAFAWIVALALRPLLAALGGGARSSLWIARGCAGLIWIVCWILAGGRWGFFRPLLLVGARRAAETLGVKWRLLAPLALALMIDLSAGWYRGDNSPGRLAYAMAVAGGVVSLDAFREGIRWGSLKAHMILATGSWVFLAYVEAWELGTLALATPVLSLVTIPFLSVFAYPLLLISAIAEALGLSSWSSELAGMAASAVTGFLVLLLRATLAVPTLWVVSHWALAIGVGLAGATLALWGTPRMRAAIAVAVLVAGGAARAASGEPAVAAAVRQLAVGQGDAALVLSRDGSAGLIDAGSSMLVTDGRWIELLAKSGVHRLKWVALTHLDEDHAGGLHPLSRLLPIDCVETDLAQWESERGRVLAIELASAAIGVRAWSGGCVPYPTLAPTEHERSVHRANSAMGAVWVPMSDGSSYLSAGDAVAEDEPRIGAWARELSRSWERRIGGRGARILKISHHGSKTSSAGRFLDGFRPDEAWISLGRNNLYGHPHPSVLARLKDRKLRVRRTDLEGDLAWP